MCPEPSGRTAACRKNSFISKAADNWHRKTLCCAFYAPFLGAENTRKPLYIQSEVRPEPSGRTGLYKMNLFPRRAERKRIIKRISRHFRRSDHCVSDNSAICEKMMKKFPKPLEISKALCYNVSEDIYPEGVLYDLQRKLY